MMAVRKHVRNVGVFWKLNTPTDIFMNMLEKCIPWTQKLLFCGINSQYITPCIINLIKTNKTGEYRISICDQFEIDRTTLDNAVRNLPPLPEGYEIRQLTLKDAPIVLDPWRENAFDFYSLEQVQFCIRHLPSLGAYHHGKLVCWRITYYDGSSDMAFTLPEARRLGLSYQVGIRLATEVCKIQRGSFGSIIHGNQASLAMVTKMGYRITGHCDWLEFEPQNINTIEEIVDNNYQKKEKETPKKLTSSL